MRARKFMAVAVPVVGTIGFLAFLLSPSPCPIELQVLKLEPSGLVGDGPNEPWLITLRIINREGRYIAFNGDKKVEAKIAGHWIEADKLWAVDSIMRPGGQRDVRFLLPRAAEVCRLRLKFEPEPFKWRFWRRLSLRGHRTADKFPRLRNWVWPPSHPQWPASWEPPTGHWRSIRAEVTVPNQSTGRN